MYNLQITVMSKITFKLFEPLAIPHFDLINFVYDLSNKSSWKALNKNKEEIEKYLEPSSTARWFIIGNKADKTKMDVNKFNFFASHMEISANFEDITKKMRAIIYGIMNSFSVIKTAVSWNRCFNNKIAYKKPSAYLFPLSLPKFQPNAIPTSNSKL